MGILSSRIGQCLIINYYIYYSIATFCEQLIEQNTFSLLSWGIYTKKYVTSDLIFLKHTRLLQVTLEYSGAPAREVYAVEHHG